MVSLYGAVRSISFLNNVLIRKLGSTIPTGTLQKNFQEIFQLQEGQERIENKRRERKKYWHQKNCAPKIDNGALKISKKSVRHKMQGTINNHQVQKNDDGNEKKIQSLHLQYCRRV
jgi:hypothetical protein